MIKTVKFEEEKNLFAIFDKKISIYLPPLPPPRPP
jgi:hypothetical protein